jgi:ketosteroid isomerase-like protein
VANTPISVGDSNNPEDTMPARTPQQIFQHHAEALGAEDIDGIAADYSDDALVETPPLSLA